MTSACRGLQHAFSLDKTRDQHFKPERSQWHYCTKPLCPERYQSTRAESKLQPLSDELRPPARKQERDIRNTYGPQSRVNSPSLRKASLPLTTTSRASPRPSPQPTPSTLLEPPSAPAPEEELEYTDTPVDEPTEMATVTEEPAVQESRQIPPHLTEREPVESATAQLVQRAMPTFTLDPTYAANVGGDVDASISVAAGYTVRMSPFTQNPTGHHNPETPDGGGGGPPNHPSGGGGGEPPRGPGYGGGAPPPGPPGGPGFPGHGAQNPGLPATTPQGKGKIKEPTTFTGDRSKTHSFLDQLFLLFHGRPHDFPNDHTQITTALSYMEGGSVEHWKRAFIQRAREEIAPGVR